MHNTKSTDHEIEKIFCMVNKKTRNHNKLLGATYFKDEANGSCNDDWEWIEFALIPASDQRIINAMWLISKFDEAHQYLCPDHFGTWQQRVDAVVQMAKNISASSTASRDTP